MGKGTSLSVAAFAKLNPVWTISLFDFRRRLGRRSIFILTFVFAFPFTLAFTFVLSFSSTFAFEGEAIVSIPLLLRVRLKVSLISF